MKRDEARGVVARMNLIWPSSAPPGEAQQHWMDTVAGVDAAVGDRALAKLERTVDRWPSLAQWQDAARSAARDEEAAGRRVVRPGERSPDQVEHCPLCDPPGWVLVDDGTIHGTAHPCPNGCTPNSPARHARGRMPSPEDVRRHLAALGGVFGHRESPFGHPVPALTADGPDAAWSEGEPF